MKISKKARIAGLREAIAETLQGPVYSAYCICWFVAIAVSLVSALVLTNLNAQSLIIVLAISLIALIIPFALLKLRYKMRKITAAEVWSYVGKDPGITEEQAILICGPRP